MTVRALTLLAPRLPAVTPRATGGLHPVTPTLPLSAPPPGSIDAPTNAGTAALLRGLHTTPSTVTTATNRVHKVESYTAVSEARVLIAPLTLQTTSGTFALATGAPIHVLRTFDLDGVPSALVVDADGLRTGIAPMADVTAASRSTTKESRYTRSLDAQAGATLSRFDASATAGDQVALTIDMCQSRNPWNKDLFDSLVEESERSGKPTPCGVAMTGLWARAHPREMAQLLKWQDEGKLDITWVNHSDLHQVGNQDFLTNPRIDFHADVVDAERTLLEYGAVPSLLFRFPGLTHNDARRTELADLGLFGLDADAWLGKGQRPTDGSVILVHGNGNENGGISRYFTWRGGTGKDTTLVSPLNVIP